MQEMLRNSILWFSGGQHQYMSRWDCMSHDTFWSSLTIVLNLIVFVGYVIISGHWLRMQRKLADTPTKLALRQLFLIFAFCGVSSYLMSAISFTWPAWRLSAIVSILHVCVTVRYILIAKGVETLCDGLATSDIQRKELDSLKQIINKMPQIIWTANEHGSIDFYNQRWHDYTGQPALGKIGDESWRPVMHPDDIQKTMTIWYACVKSKLPYESDFRLLDSKTGKYRWHLSRALPILDDKGNAVKWLGVSVDIDSLRNISIMSNGDNVNTLENLKSLTAKMVETPVTKVTKKKEPLKKPGATRKQRRPKN